MNYEVDFLEDAHEEWNKLNPSIKEQFKKKLVKILENPRVPKNQLSGYPNCYKIKLRKLGYRLVYKVIDAEVVIVVITVGKRENNAVYNKLPSRLS